MLLLQKGYFKLIRHDSSAQLSRALAGERKRERKRNYFQLFSDFHLVTTEKDPRASSSSSGLNQVSPKSVKTKNASTGYSRPVDAEVKRDTFTPSELFD